MTTLRLSGPVILQPVLEDTQPVLLFQTLEPPSSGEMTHQAKNQTHGAWNPSTQPLHGTMEETNRTEWSPSMSLASKSPHGTHLQMQAQADTYPLLQAPPKTHGS